MILEPKTENELLSRADALSGLTLQQLADQLGVTLPINFQHHKGWLGQLLELALGASAGSAAAPDFTMLDIELKTIPINANGKPAESTFVCAVPRKIAVHWHDSLVWCKLKKVLWLPIDASVEIPKRKIHQAILWQPNQAQEALLQQDWQELTEMLSFGQADQLTAKHGEVLQVRPKAANSRVLKKTIDQHGEDALIVPRGFYLRPSFTAQII